LRTSSGRRYVKRTHSIRLPMQQRTMPIKPGETRSRELDPALSGAVADSPDHTCKTVPLLAPVLVCICISVALGGCAKRLQLKLGIPFGLDTIPTEKVARAQESWKDKGMRLVHDNKYKEAVESFKAYVVENPEDSFGFNALAVCYKNLGDPANAMRNYERALELVASPEEKAKILGNIGNLYFSADKPQAALGFYKEAAAECDNNPLYLALIARTFIVLQEYDRARKVLAEAEKLQSRQDKHEREEDRGLAPYLMAQAYAALNEEEKVLDYLRQALKANPAKFVPRLKKDLSDEKSLLYTLKEDPAVSDILSGYSLETLLDFGFDH
jgi:tetratricopeptide (TPR) repeat protein